MALYAIGDLHLSLTANKSMEVFGPPGKIMSTESKSPSAP